MESVINCSNTNWKWEICFQISIEFVLIILSPIFKKKVFERGLKAIPLSVDLWIHYLTHVKQGYVDNEEYIRSQFERAVNACGLEFRSDKLWEAYIKWETETKRLKNVINVYNKLLATPTQGYSSHFEKYAQLNFINARAFIRIPFNNFFLNSFVYLF